MPAAADHFLAAIRLAEVHRLEDERALARMHLAVVRQAQGDIVEALTLLDVTSTTLNDGARGQIISQRGYIHWMQGQPQLALDAYDEATPLLVAADEEHVLIRVHGNRGVALAQVGRLRDARRAFEEQLQLARTHGRTHFTASALHNLGWLHGRLGNVPDALSLLAAARTEYLRFGDRGRSISSLDTDQCEVLLQAMLAPEADEIAARVVEAAERSGNTVQVAEARLMRARSLLIMRRFDHSIVEATTAREMFERAGRRAWAARASYFVEQARVSTGRATSGPALDAGAIAGIADSLAEHGWFLEAAEVRVHAGRTALDAGLTDLGREQLALAATARRTGTAALRAEAWHATALLRLADGDERSARRAIDAGLRALDHHRATLGAIELRAHASAHGVELGRLGLRLALERHRAADVLTWAERWRAGALALPTSQAVADEGLAALRELHATAANEPDATLPGRIADAERAVTTRARFAAGDARSLGTRLHTPTLRRSLAARTLVEFVELDGALHAVVVTPTRSRLVHLGDTDAALAAHDHLTFALRRLSMLPLHHPGLDAAASALDRAAHDVDELLIAPLGVRTEEVVIVPTGGLHRIAWSALPSLHHVAVTVAPSAAWWMARGAGPRPPIRTDRVLLVEGPDLEGTSAELGAIAELIPNAVALLRDEATAARVIAELATADVAHIAAHGAFRSDNPLFSSLRVADGPIWVHDLAALPRTPRLVILTACEAGRSGVLAGDELLGTATALLSLGVDTVVAPLLPVPDIATARFAIRLHHHLATGATPAQARARTAADERASGDPTGVAVASTFQCIGNRRGDSSRSLYPTRDRRAL